MTNYSFLVAQLGARMHYAIPQMLHAAGQLEHFYTDICAVKGWPQLLGIVPGCLQPDGMRRLLGRVPNEIPLGKITALTSLGWKYANARRAPGGSVEQKEAVHISFGKRFCESIVHKGFGSATATYTFNSAGLELMRAAKKAGLKTVMEQTIAPRAVELEILAEATQRYPGWSGVVTSGPNIDAFIAREEQEWQYADLILCGSEFVREGIARRGGPVDRCRVVPYGVDKRFQATRGPRQPGPLRVLTVGEVGLRKGSPITWDSAKLIGEKANFRMVGNLALPTNVLNNKPVNVELFGPVPRSKIVEHYLWADVFLLPSLCEGSATVTYEAMLAGLPVLCTLNTGSMVIDGVSGRIVPTLSAEAVALALQEWIAKSGALEKYRKGTAKQLPQLGLEAYCKRLLGVLA